jgi:alkaline phosphatase
MKHTLCGSILALTLFCAVACAQTNASSTASQAEAAKLQNQIRGGRARNIILFIGDGMGDSEITAARNYQAGASGRRALDTLPFTGSVTTYALQEGDPSKPDYVTDSAAGGTAWATGQKTSNGRISTSAKADQPLKTILELAKEAAIVPATYRLPSLLTPRLLYWAPM